MTDAKPEKPAPEIDRTNYPSNSYTSRKEGKEAAATPEPKEEPRVEQVTDSQATQKKRPWWSRTRDVMTGEDADSVGSYILYDIAIPAFKNLIADAVSQGIERILFGSSSPRLSGGKKGNNGFTAYGSMFNSNERDPIDRRRTSHRGRGGYSEEDIVVPTRVEAERVVDALVQLIDDYDFARVSDLKQLVGITGNFQDQKWGWTNLSSARVDRMRHGFLIRLPRAEPLG